MDIDKMINNVSIENLYQHVLELEGIRHPIDALDNLNKAADYLHAKMKEYGVSVREQEFKIGDFPVTFRNIEGWIGDENEPSIVLVSHYDTTWNAPGASDNAVSNAVMLEIARILAKEKDIGTIRFLFATMEENDPVFEAKERKIAQKWGLKDEYNRFKSYQTKKLLAQFDVLWKEYHYAGEPSINAMKMAHEKFKGRLSEPVEKYLMEFQEIYPDGTATENAGKCYLIGSEMWVTEAMKTGKKIKMVICLDVLGFISKKEHSQNIPTNMPLDIFKTYKADLEKAIGDFIFIVATSNVEKKSLMLCQYCEYDSIDLPYARLLVDLSVKQAFQLNDGILGSDHTPFWKRDIPVIFMTDIADDRYPYIHSMADTIDKLDFDHVAKICKAVLATLIGKEM